MESFHKVITIQYSRETLKQIFKVFHINSDKQLLLNSLLKNKYLKDTEEIIQLF